MQKTSKIYIAGHRGLVGSAIKRQLEKEGYRNIVFRTSEELDLRDSNKVDEFFKNESPEYVFIAAAKVGGIKANLERKGEFIFDNLMIQTNMIHSARKHKSKKLVFIAGGIGVTPFRSMIKYASDKKLSTPIRLIYSNSIPEEINTSNPE